MYVWQINQLCPCDFDQDTIEVDTHPKDMDKDRLYQHPSLLLLLKIVPEDEKRFAGAKLMSNDKLLLKLVTEDSQIKLRTYNLADCYTYAIVNPYKATSRRMQEFTSMLLVQRTKMDEQSDWSLTLYRPKRTDELKLFSQEVKSEGLHGVHGVPDGISRSKVTELRVLEGSSNLSIDQLLTEVLFHTDKETIIILDKLAAQIIKFSSKGLQIISLEKLGCIVSAKFVDDSLYIINKEQHVTQIHLSATIDIDSLKPRATLPADTIQSNALDNWQIVSLNKQSPSEMVEHIIYYKENKFYALPLDGCGQAAQMLTKASDTDETPSRLTWDLVVQNENLDMVDHRRTIYLVYVVEDDIYFYDVLTSKKAYGKQAISQNQGSRRNTRLICAKYQAAYVHLEGSYLLTDRIVKLPYSSGLTKLFLSTEATITSQILVSGELSEKPHFGGRQIQIEGFEKQIVLATYSEGPYYVDRAHIMPFEERPLTNRNKLKEQQLVQATISQASDTKQEERKEDILERVAQRINTIKQNLLSKGPKHIEIETYNNALDELRKEIGPVVSKLFKESQERARTAQKRLGEAEGMILWQSNCYRYPKPTIAPELNEDGLDISLKVSDEYLQAYKDIKAAKKKAVKHREKLKGKV